MVPSLPNFPVFLQLYDQVQSVEVVLYNSGKVDLDFCALGVSDYTQLTPGHPTISPTMVCIVAYMSSHGLS